MKCLLLLSILLYINKVFGFTLGFTFIRDLCKPTRDENQPCFGSMICNNNRQGNCKNGLRCGYRLRKSYFPICIKINNNNETYIN